jgi:hypothetical protein
MVPAAEFPHFILFLRGNLYAVIRKLSTISNFVPCNRHETFKNRVNLLVCAGHVRA